MLVHLLASNLALAVPLAQQRRYGALVQLRPVCGKVPRILKFQAQQRQQQGIGCQFPNAGVVLQLPEEICGKVQIFAGEPLRCKGANLVVVEGGNFHFGKLREGIVLRRDATGDDEMTGVELLGKGLNFLENAIAMRFCYFVQPIQQH